MYVISANYISIDRTTGTITVSYIDRDKDDISTYRFGILAYEVPDPVWNTSLTITLFVTDIDNNPPLVRWIIDAESDNVTFPVDEDAEKLTNMAFLENFAGTLNLTIFIRDIDTVRSFRRGNVIVSKRKICFCPGGERSVYG